MPCTCNLLYLHNWLSIILRPLQSFDGTCWNVKTQRLMKKVMQYFWWWRTLLIFSKAAYRHAPKQIGPDVCFVQCKSYCCLKSSPFAQNWLFTWWISIPQMAVFDYHFDRICIFKLVNVSFWAETKLQSDVHSRKKATPAPTKLSDNTESKQIDWIICIQAILNEAHQISILRF